MCDMICLCKYIFMIFLIVIVKRFLFMLDFFKNYVHSKPKKAVIFKGGAKLSPAFTLWTDEYLKNHPESETMQFDVEVGKKETRQGNMERRNVKEFVESYRHDDVYAVTDVPQNLQ